MDPAERLNGGVGQELYFHIIYFFAEFLRDDKIIIDDRVDQGVAKIIRAFLADAPLGVLYPLPYRVKDIPFFLLESYDGVMDKEYR